MSSKKNSKEYLRIPPWLRTPLPEKKNFSCTTNLLEDLQLNTVCQSAKCPNKWECFSRDVATFLIMGTNCTRNCRFCNINPGPPQPLEADEPMRISEAVKRLGLKHVVITSVTRDDLPDGGAAHFAAVLKQIQKDHPSCTTEVLIPDFQGDEEALKVVLEAKPNILNHNVETAPDMYETVRPEADYKQSIELLARVKKLAPEIPAKSGLMVGLGESKEGILQVIDDLAAIDCDIVTIGQYMRPTIQHPEVKYYMPPEEFEELGEYGKAKGIKHMFSAPLVRSSYNADMFIK